MNEAKFVTGKLSRHILKMASTSSIGLIAIFFVDLLDLFFIGLLDEIDNVQRWELLDLLSSSLPPFL